MLIKPGHVSLRQASAGAVLIIALAWCGGLPRGTAACGEDKKPAGDDIPRLNQDLAVLRFLYLLEATPEQFQRLHELARETAAKPGSPKPVKASAEFVKTLRDLRKAMVTGDHDKIAELDDKLEKLRDEEKLTFDNHGEITPSARKQAPQALHLFSARQAVNYLTTYGDDTPDPIDLFFDTVDVGHGLNATEWKVLRAKALSEIGWMIAGLDADAARKISQQVEPLLDKAHKWKPDELAAHQAETEQSLHRIMGDLGPTDVLQHILEYDLAELLSNPRLAAIVDELQKTAAKPPPAAKK